MKHRWKKAEKHLYLPKSIPQTTEIPALKFFTLEGIGNPNEKPFADAVKALYSLSYAVKHLPKKGFLPEGYYNYSIYPLEGIWNLTYDTEPDLSLDKDMLRYKIMIRQPDFVTDDIVCKALNICLSKKKINPLVNKIVFETMTDGLCVQIMHVGPYGNAPESFQKLTDYCIENNLIRKDISHRTIYISDPRKSSPNNLKTVLRYCVEHI